MKKHLFRLLLALLAAVTACSDALQPVPFQGISGNVTFLGTVPDSTDWVRLVVYRQLPDEPMDLLDFTAFGDTLPLALPAGPYVLGLPTGSYAWLPVVWKRAGVPLSPEALRVIGWYTAGGAPFDPPRAVRVEQDRETIDINLIGDFGSMLTAEEALELIR